MGIEETGKKVYFHTSIMKRLITIHEDVGWLWFNFEKHGEQRWLGSRKDFLLTLTTEDAKNLSDAINKLLTK